MNRELETFTYSISHDLRAPLRAINGYVNIIKEDYGSALDDEGRRAISIALNEATRMDLMIGSLLEFSHIQYVIFQEAFCEHDST